jgi:hypothetical protein
MKNELNLNFNINGYMGSNKIEDHTNFSSLNINKDIKIFNF